MDPSDPQAAKNVNDLTDALNNNSSAIDRNKNKNDALAETFGKQSEKAQGVIDSIIALQKEAERFDLSKVGDGIKTMLASTGVALANAGRLLTTTMSQTMGALESITDEGSTNVARILNTGIPLAIAQLNSDLINARYEIPMFKQIEAGTKSAQKSIYQMTIPFAELRDQSAEAMAAGEDLGGAFQQAQGGVRGFDEFLAQSIQTTRQSQEAITTLAKDLGDTFGPAAIQPFENLRNSTSKFESSVTQVNAAILIANATGMNNSAIAQMMKEAYLDLGSSIDETINMFGGLFDAATRSGIGFERTARSIMESTKMLKFWGGTVDSITPLFNTFSQSLQGIGRQGLTPELLNSFVSGLNQMNFSTRALLSMQAPGMRGGGILGGGLRMEAALEQGPEGMREIVSSLTDTLKRFGGPQILTREQAIESPALTRNYMIQRQLLGQMMNISDPARQNQMMRILQDIDQGGIVAAGDQEAAFNELMSAGEQVGNETVTAIDRASQTLESAIISQGSSLLEALNALGAETGANMVMASLQDIVRESARGQLTPNEMLGRVGEIIVGQNRTPGGEQTRADQQRQQNLLINTLSKAAIAGEQQEMRPEIAESMMEQMRATATPREKERFIQEGAIPEDIINITKARMAENIKSQKSLKDTIKDLDNQIKDVALSFSQIPMEQRAEFGTMNVVNRARQVNETTERKSQEISTSVRLNIIAEENTIKIKIPEEEKTKIIELSADKAMKEARSSAVRIGND